MPDAARDVQAIIDTHKTMGLVLNRQKCEIIASNFDLVDQHPVFRDFKRVHKEDLVFLGSPVLPGRSVDKVLQEKIQDLQRAISRLSLLQAHDGLCLLKN